MWGWIAVISWLSMVAFPPLVILAAYATFKWVQSDIDKADKERDRIRLREQFNTSHPGPCSVCGAQAWSKGKTRLVNSGDIRGFMFPLHGQAAVVVFTCSRCGAFGRYARPYDSPEIGWTLMDRYLGGW